MGKSKFHKITSMFLVMVMMLTMLGMTAFAEESTSDWSKYVEINHKKVGCEKNVDVAVTIKSDGKEIASGVYNLGVGVNTHLNVSLKDEYKDAYEIESIEAENAWCSKGYYNEGRSKVDFWYWIKICKQPKLIINLKHTGHIWSEWKVTKEPTCTEKGEKERSCTECDEKETEDIDALGHKFSEEWKYDETEHWHECTVCGAKDEETESEHVYGEWKVTKEPTCTEKGEKERTCTECGKKETENIDALGHKFGEEWKYDETEHWHECTVCGAKDEETAHEHVYEDEGWQEVKPATATEKGVEENKCTVCEYPKYREVDYKGSEVTDPTDPSDSSDDENTSDSSNSKDKKASSEKTDAKKADSKTVKTGDENNILLWIALMALAGAGVTGGVVLKKKNF